MLAGGRKLFSQNGIFRWTFQQDNDPTHNGGKKIIQDWNAKHNSSISSMVWPPNSPDLSPIENIWSYVQGNVDKQGCANFQQFKAAVLWEMANIPKTIISNLYKSMPKRVASVVALGGGKTRY